MQFNEKIIRLRKTHKLTQNDFAQAVGVSRQAVYKWEQGQSYPEASKLLAIKALFSVSIDDLLDDNFEVSVPEKPKKKRPQVSVKVPEATVAEAAAAAFAAASVEAEQPEEQDEGVTAVPELVGERLPSQPEPLAGKETDEGAAKEKKKGFFSRLFNR